MSDPIYFLPPEDKPVKLIIEDKKIDSRIEKYNLTIKEVLLDILRWNYILRRNLTKQQIHSERGKVKRENYNEVINFLSKRGIPREFIEYKVNEEHTRIVFTSKFHIDSDLISGKFGIIEI